MKKKTPTTKEIRDASYELAKRNDWKKERIKYFIGASEFIIDKLRSEDEFKDNEWLKNVTIEEIKEIQEEIIKYGLSDNTVAWLRFLPRDPQEAHRINEKSMSEGWTPNKSHPGIALYVEPSPPNLEKYIPILWGGHKIISRGYKYEWCENCLIVGINLNRPQGLILKEIKNLLDMHQDNKKLKAQRLTYVRKVSEYLEVWDLWEKAGQKPWQRTFPAISRKVKRKLSTVKMQWYRAHKLIIGKPYDPMTKYATEEKRRKADELCLKCRNVNKCYKSDEEKNKRYYWIPCADYTRIAGKEFLTGKMVPLNENIRYDDDIESD
jgi:hypothetical protein